MQTPQNEIIALVNIKTIMALENAPNTNKLYRALEQLETVRNEKGQLNLPVSNAIYQMLLGAYKQMKEHAKNDLAGEINKPEFQSEMSERLRVSTDKIANILSTLHSPTEKEQQIVLESFGSTTNNRMSARPDRDRYVAAVDAHATGVHTEKCAKDCKVINPTEISAKVSGEIKIIRPTQGQ